LPEKVGNLAN